MRHENKQWLPRLLGAIGLAGWWLLGLCVFEDRAAWVLWSICCGGFIMLVAWSGERDRAKREPRWTKLTPILDDSKIDGDSLTGTYCGFPVMAPVGHGVETFPLPVHNTE